MIYLDTSVVAPFYWAEALSDAVENLFRNNADLAMSPLVEVELVSALSRRVRMREIERQEAMAIAERFRADLEECKFRKGSKFDIQAVNKEALILAIRNGSMSPF